jgi:hypothetical protein
MAVTVASRALGWSADVPGWLAQVELRLWEKLTCDRGAPDRASPNFMGLASLGPQIGIFCDFRYTSMYSVLLLNAVLGLDFLGLALSRPQVQRRAEPGNGPRRVPQRRDPRPAGGSPSAVKPLSHTPVYFLYIITKEIYRVVYE